MNILIVGSGGREDALYRTFKASDKVDRVYVAPGNGYSQSQGDAVPIEVTDCDGLVAFAESNVDVTIVVRGTLAMGIVDRFGLEGLAVFGPPQKSAQLESSKDFSKRFMEIYNIPTAASQTVTSYKEAMEKLPSFKSPYVIKADGLCAGKGVLICADWLEAREAFQRIFVKGEFGAEGEVAIIEDYLDGPESSLLCIVSGNKLYPMETAMDYKKIYDGDLGPNTGGVGCLSPNPHWNEDFDRQSNEILRRIEKGLEKEGLGYSGVLFIGYKITDGKLNVLEFNVRFGDPETEVVLPRLKTDLVDVVAQSLTKVPVAMTWSKKQAVCVILTAGGYPDSYEKNHPIYFGDLGECYLMHNGTQYVDGEFYTAGGRVLTLGALSDTVAEAREKVYETIDQIGFQNVYYRKDIGILS